MVTLPYQYTPTTWYNPPSVSTKSEYGRNGVPWLQREVTGEFSAAAADKVYHTRLTQFATSYVPSTYTYFYNQVRAGTGCIVARRAPHASAAKSVPSCAALHY